MTLFKIGDFAKLAQISAHRLRNYDKQGLLHPVHIDQDTGYRYYSAEQLGKLNRILVFRGLGLSIAEIKIALIANINVEQMEQMLLQRQTKIEQEIVESKQQLQQVRNRLQQIKEESQLPVYDIVVKSLPSYPIASIRMMVRNIRDVAYYCNALHPEIHKELAQIGVHPKSPTINLYHMPNYSETDIDLEASVVVLAEHLNNPTNSRVKFRLLKEVPKAATLLFSEDYSQIDLAIMSFGQWSAREGYRIADAVREVHYAPMVNTVKSHVGKPVVELQFPIEKIAP